MMQQGNFQPISEKKHLAVYVSHSVIPQPELRITVVIQAPGFVLLSSITVDIQYYIISRV